MTLTHIRLALALMLLLSIVSCKSPRQLLQSEVTNTINHDTVLVNRVLHDSVYVYESERTLSGSPIKGREGCIVDTLVKNHVESRWRIRHDSVYVNRVDTVQKVQKVPVEVVKEVARKRNWFDWLCYGVTGLLVIGIGLAVARKMGF